jgi:hypothetical protein
MLGYLSPPLRITQNICCKRSVFLKLFEVESSTFIVLSFRVGDLISVEGKSQDFLLECSKYAVSKTMKSSTTDSEKEASGCVRN